jgi:asparagine synthase (glutamine-hydrolysing)
MCGLAGVLTLAPGVLPRAVVLQRMIAQLASRGPDATGAYRSADIALSHARLGIIDLAGGNQPIHNERRTVWTVFNGEIFNYRELRATLERQGHRFYTQTDTEVIVHLYEQHGDDFVQHLNGQFAIALWDEPARRLLLVRDRPGILPLFFMRQGDQLLFASEVKALLPAMTQSPRLDPRALDQLMTFWAPAGSQTLFQGVESVLPGEMIVVEDGMVRRQRYWDWRFPAPDQFHTGDNAVLAEELRALLVDATRLRLRADVPVGAYLSGGLDSSGIAALVQAQGGVQLRTFSLGFDDAALDEGAYQQAMAAHLGTDHSQVLCTSSMIGAEFEETIWRTETPILRTAPVPMGVLSGHVRDAGFKVVLTGEGADEVFGGYDLFKETKIRQFWARRPDSHLRPLLLKRLYPYLELQQLQSPAYLQRFFGQGLDNPSLPWFSHLPRWTTTAQVKTFFSAELASTLRSSAIDDLMAQMPTGFGGWHPFNRAECLEAKTLLSGYLLSSQGDRMLMRHSVEGRFPFLDHRVIEFANRLHPKYKMRGLNEKYLLKKALSPYLPASILARHKQPYRAPDIPAFIGSDGRLLDYVRDVLGVAAINRAGYFDAAKVALLLRKIERGNAIGARDNMAFVGMLSTQLWHRHFIENFHKLRAAGGAGNG